MRADPSRLRARLRRHAAAVAFGLFSAIALFVYAPALDGEPVTDDALYLTHNPYTATPSVESLIEIIDPGGSAAMYVANYQPVLLLAHGAELALFDSHWRAHHLVNVVLHAAVSVLLGLLLARNGVRPALAWGGGLLFLVHPANVEAVAWMSQLKTIGALLFTLAALLAVPRRPRLATLSFGVGLLVKAQALAALPFVALQAWQTRRDARDRVAPSWPLAWTALLGLYLLVQLPTAIANTSEAPPLHTDPVLRALNIAVIGLRYLGMAVSGVGLSTFAQPAPVLEGLGPWTAAVALVYGLLAWRLVAVLRAGRPEARFWLFALAGFAPVSQVFPFQFPLADRYLYFMLPGLIGATALAAQDALARLAPRSRLRRALAAAVLALLALFAWHAHERARVWRGPTFAMADAELHYPDGVTAHLLRARRAALRGDAAAARTALARARERGFSGLSQILSDPAYAAVARDAGFRAEIEALGREWVRRFEARRHPTQLGLVGLARTQLLLGDEEEALRTLARARALGGPLDAEIDARIEALRRSSARGDDDARAPR